MKKPFVSALGASTALLLLACSGEPLAPMGNPTSGTGGMPANPGSGGNPGGTPGNGGNSAVAGSTSMAGSVGQAGSAAGNGGGAGVAAGDGGVAGTSVGGTNGDAGASNAGRGGTPPSGGAAGQGTAGSAGAAGQGTAGSASAGTGGGSAMSASTGCEKAASQALNQWVESMVMSGNANRPYSVRLPTGYDNTRPYPVIVLLHGCSSGTNNVPMEQQTGTNAILIRGTGSAANTCWDTGANGPDVAFFDAMVADTKARFCTDTSRFVAVGYSSGSWLINQLTCIRSDVLRAAGTVAGGESGRNCMGKVAHMFIHDQNDNDNQISGSERARDRLLMQNGCSNTTMPQEPSPCVRYQGCDPGYPVVWCPTSGRAHNRQDNVAPAAFWNFFSEF